MQNVADQMPATWVEKWNQWRYMAMLANPKTHFRNFVGNAAFMPVVEVKELMNAAIQAAAEKMHVMDSSQRTTTVRATKAAKEYAAADYLQVQDTLRSGGKYNPSNELNDKRTIFQNKVLEAVRKGNGWLLEASDGLFLKRYYTRALARYLTAQKVDLNNISPGNTGQRPGVCVSGSAGGYFPRLFLRSGKAATVEAIPAKRPTSLSAAYCLLRRLRSIF